MPQSVEEFARTVKSHLKTEVQREIQDGHAFFRTWYAGTLTRDQLGAFFQNAYFECFYALRALGRLLSLTPNRDAFRIISQNLADELGNGNVEHNHADLILRLAAFYGRPLGRVLEEGPVVPLVTLWSETACKYAERSFAAGLAGGTYFECAIPPRFAQQRKALIEHYGVELARLAWYDQHLSLEEAEAAGGKNITDAAVPGYGGDDVHVERQVALIATLARSTEEQQLALQAVSAVCDAKIKYYLQMNEIIGGA